MRAWSARLPFNRTLHLLSRLEEGITEPERLGREPFQNFGLRRPGEFLLPYDLAASAPASDAVRPSTKFLLDLGPQAFQ